MVGFDAKVLLDGVCTACVTTLFVWLTINGLADDGRGTLLSQDPPWPQMIGEQRRSISVDHYTNSCGYRFVLSYARLLYSSLKKPELTQG